MLDPRKAAVRTAVLSGSIRLADLPRFVDALAENEGAVNARLAFSRDEESRYIVELEVSTEVMVECQRCLEPMPLPVYASNRLAIVGDEEQAKMLPQSLDPVIVPGEECSLWELVEEELILTLPFANYHDTEACRETLRSFNAHSAPPVAVAEKPNPFDVLGQLIPDKKQ